MNSTPEIPLTPDEQINVIKRSLRCFGAGLISLLPGIGIFPAGYVFWAAHRIRRRCLGKQNPAGHYVDFGVWCACGGLLLTFTLIGLLLAAAINNGGHYGGGSYYMEE